MLARFEDQVAIVTGGAAGIGRAIVERLADDGATVVVADINEKDGREVAEAIGTEKAVFHGLDVSYACALRAPRHPREQRRYRQPCAIP